MSRRGMYYGGCQNSTAPRSARGNAFSRQALSRSSSTSSSSSNNTGSCRPSSASQRTRRPPQPSSALQRKQSASSDAFAFAESVQTPPLPSYTADYAQAAAATPQSQPQGYSWANPYQQPQIQQIRPPQQQYGQPAQPALNRTMSGGSTGFGSMYGGFYNTGNSYSNRSSSNLAAQNSFYGNMGSFYGGFGGDAGGMRPSSRSDGAIDYSNGNNAPFMNTSQYGQGGFVASPENENEDDDGDLLSRTTSSGRVLRRRVSFSGVPPLNDEGQRTVAHAPKRVGSRGPNWQRALEADANGSDSATQYWQQQQMQPAMYNGTMNSNTNQQGLRGFGSMYGRNPNANVYYANQNYNPYGVNAASYGGPFQQQQQQQQQQQGFGQPRYIGYGGGNYATFTNGTPMMMQPRPMMNGYHF